MRDRGFRVQERDLDLLLALAKMRLLRTSDLARLFFDAVGTCQKRMRKLFDHGLVRAVVADLAAENRYALTPMGHALLVEAVAQGEIVPAFRPAPRADGRSLFHLDLLNRYRIALAKEAPSHGVELIRFVPEWELRAEDRHAILIPDATLLLDLHGTRLSVALEVDVGTEPPMTVVKKVDAYDARSIMGQTIFGLRSPYVLIVAHTPRRARSLARALVEARLLGHVLLGAVPHVLVDGGLTRGLAEPRDLARVMGAVLPDHLSLGLCELLRQCAAPAREAKSA